MWNNQKQQKSCFPVCHTYKLTIILYYISKSEPTYRAQMVNARHQTPRGQSAAKPGTSL